MSPLVATRHLHGGHSNQNIFIIARVTIKAAEKPEAGKWELKVLPFLAQEREVGSGIQTGLGAGSGS